MKLARRFQPEIPYWYCMSGCLLDDTHDEGGGSGPNSDAEARAHAEQGHRVRVKNGSSVIYEPAEVTVDA